MLEGGAFGASGRQILVEDCLHGEETSIHLVVSGRDFVVLPTSQDHKRAGDGDTGANTAEWAPIPRRGRHPRAARRDRAHDRPPSVEGIAAEGIDFRGTLYIGLMLTPQGPQCSSSTRASATPRPRCFCPGCHRSGGAALAAANGRCTR